MTERNPLEPSAELPAHDASLIEAARREADRDERTRSSPHSPARPADIGHGSVVPDSIAGYQILRQIHGGAQGVVYQAQHRSTKRRVAIKVLRQGPFASPADRARFEREVQVLGVLQHPNIVAIHDSGVAANGSHYFVMDYVSGHPLDEWIASFTRRPTEPGKPRSKSAGLRAVKLATEEILRVFAKICDAVNTAHLRGVIHRDLKPSNIRVDESGEPHILDFGLAKVALSEIGNPQSETGNLVTMTGDFIGSLPWASPEQAQGVPSRIDMRTDVYSLGVILYQMLTGEFPYRVVGNIRDVLDRIMRAEPARPSAIGRRIDDDIETIVLKCLAKERDRRYQTAGELARDIRHYLGGEPIEAKRDSLIYVARKLLARHRSAVAAGIAGIVLVAAAAVVLIRSERRTATARGGEEAARRSSRLFEAQFLANRGDYGAALLATEPLTTGRPVDVEAHLLTARALLGLRRFDDARRALEHLLLARPDASAAQDLLDELDHGARRVSDVRKRLADTPLDCYLMALTFADHRAAIELLNHAISLDPAYFEALVELSSRLYRIGQFADSKAAAERAVSVRPRDPVAWYNLGAAWLNLRRLEKSREALERAIALDERCTRAWSTLGQCSALTGDFAGAVRAYGRAAELGPGFIDAWAGLARSYLALGQLEPAKIAIDRALALDPNHAEALYNLGAYWAFKGNHAAALDPLERCVGLDLPDKVALFVTLAECYRYVHNDAAEIESLRNALRLEPRHVNASNILAWKLLMAKPEALRDPAEALVHAWTAVALAPEDGPAIGTLGLAEVLSGDYPSALAHALRALELSGDQPEAWDAAIAARAAIELNLREFALALRELAATIAANREADADLSAFLYSLDERLCEAPTNDHSAAQ